MVKSMPGAAGKLADTHPDIWKAYAALGRATAEAGPLSDRERRLVKLALAIGAGSEGAVHPIPAAHVPKGSSRPQSRRSHFWPSAPSACPARWPRKPGSKISPTTAPSKRARCDGFEGACQSARRR